MNDFDSIDDQLDIISQFQSKEYFAMDWTMPDSSNELEECLNWQLFQIKDYMLSKPNS